MENISFVELLIIAAVAMTLLAVVGFVVVNVRTRDRRRAEDEPSSASVEVKEPEAPTVEEPRVQESQKVAEPEPDVVIPDETLEVIEAPEPVVEAQRVEERVSFADKLRNGLSRTREALGGRLGAILSRDKLDEEAWEEIEEALIRADVGVSAATKIVEQLREMKPSPDQVEDLLAEQLTALLGADKDRQLRTEPKPAVWLVTGVNGVGKTTTIAKLANRLRGEGHQVVLAAGDTFRAAAIDQLGTWADRVGVHMVKHAPESDPSAVVFDAIAYAKARDIDVVIADTAGRLHTKSNLMEELKKIRRVAEREAGDVAEVLLVLDATVGQNGISQAKAFQEAIDVTGVVLTKLDGTAKGGIVVAIQDQLNLPVKAIGVGESMDDLQPFDPVVFVRAMLSRSES